MGHRTIGTEHLLLGVIRAGSGVAARVLQDLGVQLEAAQAQVLARHASEPSRATHQPAAVHQIHLEAVRPTGSNVNPLSVMRSLARGLTKDQRQELRELLDELDRE